MSFGKVLQEIELKKNFYQSHNFFKLKIWKNITKSTTNIIIAILSRNTHPVLYILGQSGYFWILINIYDYYRLIFSIMSNVNSLLKVALNIHMYTKRAADRVYSSHLRRYSLINRLFTLIQQVSPDDIIAGRQNKFSCTS